MIRLFKRTEDKRPRKPGRPGKWYREEHLFGGVTYRCSRCGARFRSGPAVCPKCGARNGKVKNDPVWVDEMGDYDLE